MKPDKRRLIITVHREGTLHLWSVRHNGGPGNGTTVNGTSTSSGNAWGAAFKEAAKHVGLSLP